MLKKFTCENFFIVLNHLKNQWIQFSATFSIKLIFWPTTVNSFLLLQCLNFLLNLSLNLLKINCKMNYYVVSFLFSLFLTSISQQIAFDPQNPYCATFSGSICQSCGLSNSNTYALYDQICTPVVTGDQVLNGQIISRKPLITYHIVNCRCTSSLR